MKSKSLLFRIAVLFALALAAAQQVHAQFNLTTSNYTQDFNSLGTTNSSPTGGNLNLVSTNLNGWYFLETGTGANTTITANNGSGSSGDTYNYGATSGSDRSLGGLQSGTVIPSWGFWFSNSLGATITNLQIVYTGETWRVGTTNRSDSLAFGYSGSATNLSGTFTNSSSLGYTNSPSAVLTNGSATGAPVQTATISNNLSVTISAGGTFFIRWSDFNASGADDGMSIDNFSLTAFVQQIIAALNWVGGSGNWDTGFGATVTNGAALSFSGAGGIATNNLASPSIASMTFSNGAGSYTVAGNGFTISNGIVNNSANGQTFSNAITLGGAQTFDAASGDLTFAGNIDNNGNLLVVSGASNTFVSGIISGAAGLTKSGLGTLTLNGGNTFTGSVTINGGVVSIDADSELGNSANDIVLDGGTLQTTAAFAMAGGRDLSGTGTLDIANGTSLTNSGTVNMTALTLANNGTFEISGASKTISGLTFSAASTLTNTGAAATLSGNVTANNTSGTAVLAGAYDLGSSSRTNTVNNGSAEVDMRISGAISSATAATYLVKAGTGRLEITGVNTGLTGSLQLGSAGAAAAGEVVIGNKDALGLGQIRINSGTLLASTALTGANAITNALSIGGRGANLAIIGGANAIDFTGAVTFFATNNAASTLQVDNTTTLSGSIADSTGTSIDVSGSGTLILSGLTGNVFNDTFNVGSGLTVVAAKNDAFGTTTGGTVVASGGTVMISNTAYSTAEGMTISGTGVGGNGALRASGTSSYAGAVTAAANASIAADSGAALTISGALGGGGNTVSVGGAGNVLLSGAVSNGNISKTGAGTLTISNASSSFGTLTTGTGETAIATNATVTGLAGTDGLVLSGGTLTVNNGSGVTFNGALSGAGILAKTGAGTLTLGGANSYSGGTLVSTGELVGTTTSLQGNVTNNAGVTFNQSADGTYAGNLTGTGVLTKAGAGTLTLTGANSQGVGTIISAGALQIGNGGTAGSLSGDIDNAGTLIFNRSDDIAYSGVVSGAGNLVKESAGTLTLSGANDYTGGTLVSGGAVSGNTTSLQGAITNNAAVIFNQTTGGTYAGSLSGTGTLAKTGSGTLTMSGVNSFSGATTISAGQLAVNGTNANSAVTVSDSTTLLGTGQVGALTVSGTLAPGNSVGTLSAGSTIFDADGTFQLEMYDWTGSAGSGWDLLAITGDLTLNSTALNPFVIDLVSLSDGTNSGFSINFNANQNWTNTFVTYSGSQLGETFASNLFTVSTLNFSNALNGTFSITNVSGGLALLYTTSFDPGATYTWDVGSGVWSDGANWTNNAAPGNDSSLQFTGGGGTATNDQVTSVVGITFADTTGSITLEGNAFALGLGGIENDSANAHTIANNMSLSTNVSIISASNNLTISGNITNDVAAQTLTIAGGNGVTISGAISGQGDVSKIGLGTVTLSGANTFTGALSVAAGEAVVDGTLATTMVGVTSGSLALGADNALANGTTLTVDGATATFTTVTFADTIGTLILTNGGTVAGTGVLAATTYTLSGGTMAGALGAGTANVDGEVSLTGTMASTTLNVNSGGTLTLGSADRIDGSTAVVIGGGTLALGANNDTVGSFSITSGSLTGSGTLTAATYSLGGGTLTANLGAGTATASSGTTALNGTLAGDLTVSGGTVNLGSSNRLGDSSTLTITSGTLGLGANTDTVSAFSISGGNLGGAGTLTASTYTLGGGTISANLGGGTATATTGSTTVDGNLGGTLTASGGTVALNGTLADDLTVSGGTVNLGSANRLDDASTLNISSGTLGMGANSDTVALFTISGGTLGGTGTLTAGSYALQGGTVSANLGTGTATASTGTTTINGNLGGAITASGGTANLNGTVAGNVTVSGGTVNLGSNDRIGNSSSVSVSSGALAMGTSSDTVGTVQVTGGEISGSGTLTGSSYDVQAGTISTALGGSGALAKTGAGTATLSGNSSTYSGAVTVNDGTLLVANNNALGTAGVTMSDGAVVANNGRTIANNFTIGTAGVTNASVNTFVAGWDFQTTTNGGTAIVVSPNTPKTILANFGDQAGTAAIYLNGTNGSFNFGTDQLSAFGGTGLNATNSFVSPSVTMSTTTTTGALAVINTGGTANGQRIVFSLDMDGLKDLQLSYASQRTTTGFTTQTWSYSTDAISWTNFYTNSTVATSFAVTNAPTLASLDNTGTVYIGLTLSGAASGSQNNRLDNILMNASTIGVTNASSGSGILGIEEAGSATFSGGVTVNNTATFTAASGGVATFSGTVSGNGSVTKTGAGTVTLSGNNTYAGGTTLSNGVLRLETATGAGTGEITQTDGTSTLAVATPGTITNNMSVYNVAFLDSATLSGTIAVNNATFDVVENETGTLSGVVDGEGGVTKTGLGQLTLSGDNTYTGATAVNAGVLELASTVGGAAASTSSVSVASGAVLLISQSNQVNNSASVTLSGGTIQRGSGVSEVFGNLNLTEASFLDFGTGTTGTLSFGTYTPSALLTVQNFLPGNTLTFGSNLTDDIGNGALFSFQGDFTSSWNGGTSTFTITAIPEPSTYAAAIGLLGLMLWPSRRRLIKDVKKILGMTPPMRDRLARRGELRAEG